MWNRVFLFCWTVVSTKISIEGIGEHTEGAPSAMVIHVVCNTDSVLGCFVLNFGDIEPNTHGMNDKYKWNKKICLQLHLYQQPEYRECDCMASTCTPFCMHRSEWTMLSFGLGSQLTNTTQRNSRYSASMLFEHLANVWPKFERTRPYQKHRTNETHLSHSFHIAWTSSG